MLIVVTLLISLFAVDVAAYQSKFLLLMGPSGSGKSTLIQHLKKFDDRFVYIKPFTTRDLREGEHDKVHVTLEQIQRMQEAGELLTVNCIYGIYYATPKKTIDEALQSGKFPVLDWPAEKIAIMQEAYHKQLYCVYVQPDDIDELKRRLSLDARDKNGARFAAGIEEIDNFLAGKYNNFIDFKVVNSRDKDYEIAQDIYKCYIQALE